MLPSFRRVPRHVAVIPDGNRRWAEARGLKKEEGYAPGLRPAWPLYQEGMRLGIEEVSVFGFTQDNTRRPRPQVQAFQEACVQFARAMVQAGVPLQTIGDASSSLFPPELIPLCRPPEPRPGWPKINLLVNYGWRWDLETGIRTAAEQHAPSWMDGLGSRDVSRVELVVRWGGRRRLSGMLPIQTAYADFYVVDALWPDFELTHMHEALAWYQDQDVTLGG
jgi:undecaprenyl diphosphate synthase